MTRPRLIRRFARDARGATALEYGLVFPVFALMLMGGFWVGTLTYAISSLDHSVQTAARCMAVDVNNCGSAAATQTYAQNSYAGPNISPVFTATATGCGHTVTAQANFDLNILPGIGTVPLSVSACYP
jgi:Flp pilus assembly protein TadG